MSYEKFYEVAIPTPVSVSLQAGQDIIGMDSVTHSMYKMDSSGNVTYLGSTAVPNVVLVGKQTNAGATGIAVTATVSAGVATVTHTSHGYSTGDVVVMAGATSGGSIGDFNQLHVITSVATNTYTFATTATVSITGSPVESFWFSGTRSLNPTLIKNVVRNSTGNYTFTTTNTQADAFYGIGPLHGVSGTVGGVFFSTTTAPTTTAFTVNFINQAGTGGDTSYLCVRLAGII